MDAVFGLQLVAPAAFGGAAPQAYYTDVPDFHKVNSLFRNAGFFAELDYSIGN
jgi:hypothetical protein